MDSSSTVCHPTATPLDCEFARARAYFEHNHFESAAVMFHRIAFDPTTGERGFAAARLMLESMNVLGSKAEPPRPACFTRMESDVQQLLAAYCDPVTAQRAEFCRTLLRISLDSERLAAQKLVEEADRDPRNAADLYRDGGDRYLQLFDRECRSTRPGAARSDYPCDEVAYNAYRSFIAGGHLEGARAARAALLDPRNGLDQSELARKVAGEAPPR